MISVLTRRFNLSLQLSVGAAQSIVVPNHNHLGDLRKYAFCADLSGEDKLREITNWLGEFKLEHLGVVHPLSFDSVLTDLASIAQGGARTRQPASPFVDEWEIDELSPHLHDDEIEIGLSLSHWVSGAASGRSTISHTLTLGELSPRYVSGLVCPFTPNQIWSALLHTLENTDCTTDQLLDVEILKLGAHSVQLRFFNLSVLDQQDKDLLYAR